MFGFKKDKALVGLDIGSHTIKVLELDIKKKGKRDAYSVARIGYEPLPRDAIVEGQIIDAAAVAETIRTAFDKAKIAAKDVVISIAGNSVIIKKIALPAMESEELAESIIWEAKHNIPYPYEETNVDYAILRPPVEGGERGLEILLFAVKKDKVSAYANVINLARKNLVAIEVDAFALYNALEINYPEEFAEKAVALINIGSCITTIVIVDRGAPQLFRDLSIGGILFRREHPQRPQCRPPGGGQPAQRPSLPIGRALPSGSGPEHEHQGPDRGSGENVHLLPGGEQAGQPHRAHLPGRRAGQSARLGRRRRAEIRRQNDAV